MIFIIINTSFSRGLIFLFFPVQWLYESEDGNRSLEIGVRTTESGIITEFEDDDLKTSVINNREVTIARLAAEDECYLAIFTKEGVTFTIQTKNLTEEELLMVLRELC